MKTTKLSVKQLCTLIGCLQIECLLPIPFPPTVLPLLPLLPPLPPDHPSACSYQQVLPEIRNKTE